MTTRVDAPSTSVVWAVSSGSYSDYRVLCVCDSEERAKHVARLYNETGGRIGDAARVEAMSYVDAEPRQVTVFGFQANLWDDGSVSEYQDTTRIEWPFDMLYPEYARPVFWRWVRAPVHKGKGGRLEVNGTDQQRVGSTFSDLKARILAGDALGRRSEATGRR